MKISAKITAMAVLPIILTAAVVLGIALYQESALRDFIFAEIDRQAQSEAQKVVQSVYLMCRAAQESAQQSVDSSLRVADDILKRHGAITLDRQFVAWQAVNQFSHATRDIILPRMLFGGRWLGQIRDTGRFVPIVDDTRNLVGGTATIFQRMNAGGDMLRVATNVCNSDGNRAIATFIPAVEPDGRPNPVVTTLLRGETFRGRAFVVNAWYVTAYQPIFAADGRTVIGALYVGVEQEKLQSLRHGIMDLKVGKDGYVWVIGGHDEQQGRYIISKQGSRDGEYLLDLKDENGTPFVRRMIDRALSLPPTGSDGAVPVTFDRYPWKNPGETEARYKSVALAYYAPWDWVIGAAYYESDFLPLHQRMRAALNRMAGWETAAALLVVLFAYPMGRLVAEGIRSRVDSILTSVNDILIVTDNRDRIFLLSKAAEQLFATPLSKVKSRPVSSLVTSPELQATVLAALQERRSGVQFQFEWYGEKPGQIRTMQGRTSLVQTAGGSPVGMILAITDVTGEREVERLKNELISTAAHELSTPLTAIIGYSELLTEQQDLPDDIRQEAITYINQKAWTLSRIVDDLLDLSRIESGHELPLHCTDCDLVAIVHDVVRHARKLTTRHRFDLHLPPAAILPLDRDKIEEVLENTLSNAIKYAPQGGTIHIAGSMTPEGFHLTISDEGIGMTPEQAARIFDKFYRADSSNTAINGTGLGMTIVKHIIEAHDGQVWIESSPGLGTTVHLVLPNQAQD